MKIIAGNWKMNGSAEKLTEMLAGLGNVDTKNTIILCVPYTMLCPGTAHIQIGAQNVSQHPHGAYTGDISAEMIRATGAKYVIIGHSERRQYHNETNDIVREKVTTAIAAGLTPIICIGETLDERRARKTMAIIESGVRECIPSDTMGCNIIIAYEPRWAIGTGITPTVDEIASAHKLIFDILCDLGIPDTPILYGASVNSENAHNLMSVPHVDGVLVGGASLKLDDFIPIITSVK